MPAIALNESSEMSTRSVIAETDVPYLDVSDPSFSVRSAAVTDARERHWYARTPYGIAVLRYDEVRRLLVDQRLRQGSYAWPALNDATGEFANWWSRMLLSREGADHARLRRLGNPAFSPRLVTSLKPHFSALANELIDAFATAGRCEFIADFSEPYASRVICILLGLPHGNWKKFASIAADMGLALGVTFKRDLARIDAATLSLFEYARELIAQRRALPLGEDFLSLLIRANRESEEALSEQELLDMVVLAIFGGIDTTRNQLGLAMDVFVRHPAQWALLGAQPQLGRAAVEEVMRVRPTVTWVTREAVEDFDFEGLRIRRGTTLQMFSQAACSDPRAFPDAGFDIAAERKPHFGFGGGAHHCMGHFIARGDMTEALATLAGRLREPAFDGEPEFMPDSGNTGAIRMPIRFTAGG
jgi:cytochrome P450